MTIITHSLKMLAIITFMLLSGLIVAEPAQEQATTDSLPETEEETPIVSGHLDLGFERNSGNSNSSQMDLESYTQWDLTQWEHQLTLSGSNQKSEDVRTQEEYRGIWKALFNLNEDLYLFSNAEYEKDRIAGFEFEASETIGLGWHAIKSDRHDLELEIGVGYRHDRFLDDRGSDESQLGYCELDYVLQINSNTEFNQKINVKTSPSRTVTRSESSITSQLGEKWYFKFTYEFDYSDTVPEDTQHADERTKVGLVYKY